MRDAAPDLTARWLERIAARVSISPERIFPSDDLLDHVPVLIAGIADYVEDPTDEITADMPVVAKAMELGELRFRQGFDANEILKEYEILGGVLFSFAADMADESSDACSPGELLECAHRLFRAVSVIEQVTAAQYLRVMGERVAEREERLRRFNRLITHELKNKVGATLGAGQLLQEEWLGTEERLRFAKMVAENAQAIQKVMENLSVLSKLDGEKRRQRNIALREVVTEVFRHLRELARARDVDLRIADDLPDIEVNAAAVELSLSNYLSNAIKYSDGAAAERWADVSASVQDDGGETLELTVRVRDNGRGVPEDDRERLFERFFRGSSAGTSIEGTGLGLNLVRETMESLGGRAWAEFDDQPGSTFVFALPCARPGADEDKASDSDGTATDEQTVSGADVAATASDGPPAGAAPAKASG